MNYVHGTIYTYVWFTDLKYGMDLDIPVAIDLDSDISEQVRDEMRSAERINLHIKDKNIAGHIFKSFHYVTEDGRHLEITGIE